MDHSLYAYLSRRTTKELILILNTVKYSDDEVSTLTVNMILEILSHRGCDPM